MTLDLKCKTCFSGTHKFSSLLFKMLNIPLQLIETEIDGPPNAVGFGVI